MRYFILNYFSKNLRVLDYKKYLNFKYIVTFSSLNYLQSGISFLVSILLARELGKQDFGYFSYGLIFANTISTLMQFGTDRTLVRDLVQLKDPPVVLCSAAWVWFALGSIITLGATVWAVLFSNLDYTAALIVAACSCLGFVRGMSVMPWFDYKGKANYHSIIMLVDRVLFLCFTVVLIFFLKNEKAVIYVSFAQLATRILALSMEWRFVLKSTKLNFKPVYETIKKIINDNVWVWLAGIGNLLMTQANQLILNEKFGAEELANYGLAIQVIAIIRLLQTQLQRLTVPSIASVTADTNDANEILRKLSRFCGLTFLLSLGIILPAYFLTPFVIEKFIGVQYLSAIPVLNVLYAWSLLYGVAIIINQFLIGLRLQRFFFVSTAVFGLLSLVLAEFFVDRYKAMGAAISLLIAHFCSVVFQFSIVLKKIKSNAQSNS